MKRRKKMSRIAKARRYLGKHRKGAGKLIAHVKPILEAGAGGAGVHALGQYIVSKLPANLQSSYVPAGLALVGAALLRKKYPLLAAGCAGVFGVHAYSAIMNKVDIKPSVGNETKGLEDYQVAGELPEAFESMETQGLDDDEYEYVEVPGPETGATSDVGAVMEF